MARTAAQTPNAFVAEIARYLSVEPEDVQRLIRVAKLPAIRIPKEKRAVVRVPLRDFHGWLLKRTQNPTPELEIYDTFLADFDATARGGSRKNAA